MRRITLFSFLLTFLLTDVSAQDSIKVHQRLTTDAKLLPVLWHQQSAEYVALCYQAFNLATLRLEQLKMKKGTSYAIITDIDETILDNSYYEAQSIKDGTDFNSASWKRWSDKSAATPLPGALEFLQLAKKKKIEVFYVSNRDVREVGTTLINLQKMHLPYADEAHMLFFKDTSSKEARRKIVMSKFNVVMLLGDNLNDFAQLFEKRNSEDRKKETDLVRDQWGNKFIVLPNAVYGEWENALYDYQRKLSNDEKETKLEERLIVIPD